MFVHVLFCRHYLVNTGAHGDRDGNIITDTDFDNLDRFAMQDIKFLWHMDNATFHLISKDSPAIYTNSWDIVDAFCFSSNKFEERIAAYQKTIACKYNQELARVELCQ